MKTLSDTKHCLALPNLYSAFTFVKAVITLPSVFKGICANKVPSVKNRSELMQSQTARLCRLLPQKEDGALNFDLHQLYI